MSIDLNLLAHYIHTSSQLLTINLTTMQRNKYGKSTSRRTAH